MDRSSNQKGYSICPIHTDKSMRQIDLNITDIGTNPIFLCATCSQKMNNDEFLRIEFEVIDYDDTQVFQKCPYNDPQFVTDIEKAISVKNEGTYLKVIESVYKEIKAKIEEQEKKTKTYYETKANTADNYN